MKQAYASPAVIDFGSIADCTFATPAVRGKYPLTTFSPEQNPPGPFSCAVEAGQYAGQGGKNYLVLQCDKFGEYSHS